MSITKVNADVLDLADGYAFTGTVTGAGGGKVKQAVYANSNAFISSTTTVPFDDTIFQNTEGVEVLTAAITPTASNSILKFECSVTFGNASGYSGQLGLFQDTTADALASSYCYIYGYGHLTIQHLMTAGTTSSTTFKIRAGASGGTIGINGTSSRIGGAIPHTTFSIIEFGA